MDAARTVQVADVNGYGTSYLVAAGVQILALPFIVLARRERSPSDRITEDADEETVEPTAA